MNYFQDFSRYFSSFFFICGFTASTLLASNDPRLTMDSNGNTAAAWLAYVDGGSVIKATIKLQSGNWTYPQVISSVKSNTSDPKIYVLPNLSDISVVVLWTEESADGITSLYSAMLPSSTDSWTTPVAISGSTENVNSPQFDLVIDSSGNSTAVWVSSIAGTTWISAATSTGFTNVWSTPLSQQP